MENRNNAQEPLLQVRGLSLRFPVKQGLLDILMRRPQQAVTAVDDVDLAIYPGECLGLVGESGCGKSTLAKTIIRIYDPDAGTVTLDDGYEKTFPLEGIDGAQRIELGSHRIRTLTLDRLIKCDNPSAFPALRQIEVYGKDAKNDD